MNQIEHKPWGSYEVLLDEPNYKVKRIVLNPYERFSLQYHKGREEHWVIVEGDGINVVLNVFEGKKDLVERINITGNNTTNEDVIRGELLVDEGDPLTKLSIEKSIAELKARGIFKNVTYDITDGSAANLKNVNIFHMIIKNEN